MTLAMTRAGGAVGLRGRPAARSAPVTRKRPGFELESAYADHSRVLFGFAVNALGDRGAAEDAVQETFVRAWKARHRYDAAAGSVRTWLFAIARNVVIDAHRSRARRPRTVEAQVLEQRPEPGDPHAASLDRLLVHEALARLSPEHRQVIVAVHLSGASYDELARATNVPAATLRTRMYHGLRALRRVLDEEGGNRG